MRYLRLKREKTVVDRSSQILCCFQYWSSRSVHRYCIGCTISLNGRPRMLNVRGACLDLCLKTMNYCYMSSVLVISLRDTQIGGLIATLPNFISSARAGIVFIALSCPLKGTTIGKTEGSRVYKAGYKVDSYFVNIPTGLISSTLSAKRALNNNAFSLCLYQGTLLICNKSKAGWNNSLLKIITRHCNRFSGSKWPEKPSQPYVEFYIHGWIVIYTD